MCLNASPALRALRPAVALVALRASFPNKKPDGSAIYISAILGASGLAGIGLETTFVHPIVIFCLPLGFGANFQIIRQSVIPSCFCSALPISSRDFWSLIFCGNLLTILPACLRSCILPTI